MFLTLSKSFHFTLKRLLFSRIFERALGGEGTAPRSGAHDKKGMKCVIQEREKNLIIWQLLMCFDFGHIKLTYT